MSVTRTAFGTTKAGKSVSAFRLENRSGLSVTILDYGATVQAFQVPGAKGGPVDIVLGYDTIQEYEENGDYLGATIGRVGNRIGQGAFSLGGKMYQLVCNDGPNHLHGGTRGFDKRMWDGQILGDAVVFSRLSPDGEEGYPGNLKVSVTFSLTAQNALSIVYEAETDQDTLINLTNHSYFNLAGRGTVLNHQLQVFANRFTENDPNCLPTGRLLSVAGTPFDFRVPKPIGQDIQMPDQQLDCGHGYDHNFVLSGSKAAVLRCLDTGLELTVETDMPGMQVYSANFLSDRPGKKGTTMSPRGAICLETQLYPDGLAHYGFPCPILHAGQRMHRETRYGVKVL